MPPMKEIDQQFIDIVKKTVERGGKILVPSLGSGRAQEILVMMEHLFRTEKLEPIPIYIDGIVWDITAIYTAYPEFLNSTMRNLIFHRDNNPFLSPLFRRVGSQKERMKVIEEEGPCIILATSGMLTGGPSVEYLKYLAANPKNSLVFTSYLGKGSLGRRIWEGEREFTFNMQGGKKEMIKINLEVYKLEVSNHSDRRQLMAFLYNCDPKPRRVIVNHGESSRALDLANSVHKMLKIETNAPRNLDAIRLK